MILHAYGASDVGRVRPGNEDSFLVRADIGVFAVADGMGGHVAGEVASRTALDAFAAALTIAPTDESSVLSAMRLANLAVWERGETERDKAGMGTTLTALAFPHRRTTCIVGHVGDTRVYRLRNNQLQLLTRDHTAAYEMVERGQLTKDAARRHPLSSMLYRSVGTRSEVDIDVGNFDVQPGDLFLLCSDGLTGMLSEEDVHAILQQETRIQEMCAELIEAANLRGGVDNITAVIVQTEAD